MEQFVPFCIQIKGGHLECYINAICYWKNNLNEEDEIVSPKCHKIKILATIMVVKDQNIHKMTLFPFQYAN